MTGDCYQYAPQGKAIYNLLRHLPTGLWWDAYRIGGTVANRLWRAFGFAYDDMSAALCGLARELNPFTTEQMITDWERAVGLPDACLPQASTLDERRAWVIWRLAKRRWTTAQDWHDLSALYGITIRITPGWYVQRPALYDTCFDSVFWDLPKLGRFRVYVDILSGCDGDSGFDYTFDYAFATDSPQCLAFMCLIERIRPANVVVIFNADPVGNGWLTCGAH